MYPSLAALIIILFIAYLFWADFKRGNEHSPALWIPFLWMFFAGSRYASLWLDLRPPTPMASAAAIAEGSPIDRAVFLILILAGVIVLLRRDIDWGRLIKQNKWIVLYLLYTLSSMAWTDDPLLLLKRWIKDLGNPIMALVVLTDKRPYEAMGVILRRLAFVLLPLSILFIKYYPELGRGYRHDGSMMFTGVTNQKNDLGQLCLITGVYFASKLLRNRQVAQKLGERINVSDYLMTGMLGWLLYVSNSQTSLVCLLAVLGVLLINRIPLIAKKPSRSLTILVVGALVFSVLEATLQVKDLVLDLLGRDPSLTSRTDIWELVIRLRENPVIGTGFMSFWTGDRLEAIWAETSHGLNQAHSGYLEQYLNLGYIGLAFIGLILFSGLLKVRKHLDLDPRAGTMRLCFILAAVLYNYSEAAFYGVNNIWLLLLVGVIDVSGQGAQRIQASIARGHRPSYQLPQPKRH